MSEQYLLMKYKVIVYSKFLFISAGSLHFCDLYFIKNVYMGLMYLASSICFVLVFRMNTIIFASIYVGLIRIFS